MSWPLTRPELTAALGNGARKVAERDCGYAHGMACECMPMVTACNRRFGVISGFRRGVERPAFFRDFTLLRVVNPYRRFGTTYLSHLQVSGIQDLFILVP